MNMKDVHSHTFIAGVIAPATGNTDANTGAVDLAGFLSAEILFSIGAATFTGANTIDVIVEHSDDGVAFSAVEADDILGATVAAGGIVKTFDDSVGAHTAAGYRVGYKGGKRYVRVTLDVSGTPSAPHSVVVLAARPESTPADDQI
ncbi:MAG: hypothetical protein AAGC81_02360 [Pseudomonadota bacterium]